MLKDCRKYDYSESGGRCVSVQAEWRDKFRLLKEYTASNPEIYIDEREVSIPARLRDGFYERFDSIRNVLVDGYYGSLNMNVDALRDGYVRSEKEITELLGLQRIDLPVDLSSFLHDPRGGLVRILYNRLFELVQGKINEDDFENLANADIDVLAADLFRLGYEAWAALSVIQRFEPDLAYGVELNEDFEPVTGELKEIAFGRQFHHPAKRIPEFILHSKKLNRNIAVKMPLAREVNTYYIPFEQPVKPKKRTGDTSFVLDSRVMFLSVIPDLKKIPVFADIHSRKIQSPDLMIEFVTLREAESPEAMDKVKRRAAIMKPNLGGCVVVIDPEEGAAIDNPADNIEAIPAGFNASRLQSVIDKFA